MLKTRENCVKIYRFLAIGRVAEVMAALDCIRGARGLGILYLNCEKLIKKGKMSFGGRGFIGGAKAVPRGRSFGRRFKPLCWGLGGETGRNRAKIQLFWVLMVS